jgi:hypothetical protein
MTKNEIIEELWRNPMIDEIINNISGKSNLKEDLKMELMLILLQLPDNKIITAWRGKWLNYLVVNILKKQFQSTTSPFWKKFRRDNWSELNDYNTPDIVEDLEWQIDLVEKIETIVHTKLDLVDRELFKLYYKIGDYDRYFGDKRDVNCQKPTSSLRKIQKKLELISLEGKLISISKDTVRLSLERSRMVIKMNLKNDGFGDIDDFI